MQLERSSKLHEMVQFSRNVPIRIFRGYDVEHAFIVPHMHEALELIYITEGTLQVMDATRRFELHPGDFHIFNSNSVHSTEFNGALLKGIVLQISFKFIREMVPNADSFRFSAKQGRLVDHQQVVGHLNQLLKLATRHNEFDYLSTYAALLDLLHLLFTRFKVPMTVAEQRLSEKYFNRIQKITAYIDQHYMQEVTLTMLAADVNLNSAYLSRFIKKYFGLTFYAYVTNIRLEHAHSLLITTDVPIMKVADQVGFPNYAQFNKEFKKRYQQLPKTIRQRG